MSQFTLDDLRDIMRRSAGVDESVDLDADIQRTSFTDLGYDSLALLEVFAQIRTGRGVVIPDDAVGEVETPADLVGYVNRQAQAGVS